MCSVCILLLLSFIIFLNENYFGNNNLLGAFLGANRAYVQIQLDLSLVEV